MLPVVRGGITSNVCMSSGKRREEERSSPVHIIDSCFCSFANDPSDEMKPMQR
jgi:hypothetical protein